MGERIRNLRAGNEQRRGPAVRSIRGVLVHELEEALAVVLLGVEFFAGLVSGAVLAAVGVAEVGDCVGRAGGVLSRISAPAQQWRIGCLRRKSGANPERRGRRLS